MVNLVDTHCHVQSAGLQKGEKITRELWAKEPDLTADSLAKEAVKAGVSRMICVGCDLADSQLAIDFVRDQKNCWASIGIHPHEAQHFVDKPESRDKFSALVAEPKVVAVGETGLDYYYNHSPKEAQITILKFQIELALEHDLPLIFHVREAFDDFWPVFEQYRGIRGVLHSFTDSMENMHKAVAKGLFIGVNGIVTFTKNPAQLEVYRSIPVENLLLETDAPFLTPTPYRGNINESRYVGVIAEFIAKQRGESLEELAISTTSNARRLFGI
ncbi:MAG TPA: TatD family hydrolase [Candidatus Saccharimonadales bacterium]|nr:TatD family hydrolase [Candidatus Saccharimonadales bacterium]